MTVYVWNNLIADDCGLRCGSEAESLAYLLEVVADAYTRAGQDIRTWLYAIGRHGEMELTPIKAVHDRGDGDPSHLTVMMSWEDGSSIKKASDSGTPRDTSGPDEE